MLVDTQYLTSTKNLVVSYVDKSAAVMVATEQVDEGETTAAI